MSRTLAGLLLVLAAAIVTVPVSASEIWVRVDTGAATLSVMRGEDEVANFADIAIGRGGVSRHRRLGDNTTPLGEFRVAKVKEPSQFHRFFIIDYPNEDRARLALEDGEIDEVTFQAIRNAARNGGLPPQQTPLGGNLGIHGIGRGDPRIHEVFNWTQGCVALTDDQVDELTQWIRVGTRIVID
jgi:murein L,D-transpeptidase YafK